MGGVRQRKGFGVWKPLQERSLHLRSDRIHAVAAVPDHEESRVSDPSRLRRAELPGLDGRLVGFEEGLGAPGQLFHAGRPDLLKELLVTGVDHPLHEEVNCTGRIATLPSLGRFSDYPGSRAIPYSGEDGRFQERKRRHHVWSVKGELKRNAGPDRVTDDVRPLNTEMLHEPQATGRLGPETNRAQRHRAEAVAGSVKAEQPVPYRERRLLLEEIKPTGQKSTVNQQDRCSSSSARELKLHAAEARHLPPDLKAAA